MNNTSICTSSSSSSSSSTTFLTSTIFSTRLNDSKAETKETFLRFIAPSSSSSSSSSTTSDSNNSINSISSTDGNSTSSNQTNGSYYYYNCKETDKTVLEAAQIIMNMRHNANELSSTAMEKITHESTSVTTTTTTITAFEQNDNAIANAYINEKDCSSSSGSTLTAMTKTMKLFNDNTLLFTPVNYQINKNNEKQRKTNDVGNSSRSSSSSSSSSNNDDIPITGPCLVAYYERDEYELVYMEHKIPYDGDQTHVYWSFCNTRLGDRNIYVGLQHQKPMPMQDTFRFNNFCSIWNNKETSSAKDLVNKLSLSYCQPDAYHEYFNDMDNEMNWMGLHVFHPMPWLFDTWYAIVLRRWYVLGQTNTQFALFVYSYKSKRWTHYLTANVQGVDTPFRGQTVNGYTQCYQKETFNYQAYQRGHFRMDRHGNWEKPYVHHAYTEVDSSCWDVNVNADTIHIQVGGNYDNMASYVKVIPNQQEDKPRLSTLTINATKLEFRYFKKRLNVNWEIDSSRTPQLHYHVRLIRINDNALITDTSGIDPDCRFVSLYIHTLKTGIYYVTLDLIDVFNTRRSFRSYCSELQQH